MPVSLILCVQEEKVQLGHTKEKYKLRKTKLLTNHNMTYWSRRTAIIIPLFLVACGGSSSKNEATTELSWVSNFLSSATANESASSISVKITDAAGGVIEVKSAQSPIKGAKVVIEAESLADDAETISLSYENELPGGLNAEAIALGAKQISKVLVLGRTGSVDFAKAASVTLPFDKSALSADAVPIVVYWDTTTNSYSPVTIRSIDRAKGTVTFMTAHASKYVVIVLDKLFGSTPMDHSAISINVGFDPKVDGFFVHNFGSYDSPGGNCFGMAAYSAWYQASKKVLKGTGLVSLYKEGDSKKEEDDQIARELIATTYQSGSQKAHIEALNWTNDHKLTKELEDRFTSYELISQLIVTRQAQILAMGIGHVFNWTDGHAVTVYAYDGSKFLYYDNNYPSEVVSVPWDPVNGFGKNSKDKRFDVFAFASLNQAYSPVMLDKLYQDAEAGFPVSHYPKITMTSPTELASTPNTFEVSTDENVVLKGSALRPAASKNPNAQRYVHVYLNGMPVATPYLLDQANGSFEINIPKLPDPSGTDIMLLISENKKRWSGGFHSFKQFKVRVANQYFFKNLGFETGDFSDWFSERHLWNSSTSIIPSDKSTVVTGSQFDPKATDLSLPLFGKSVGRINNEDNDLHISSLTQTAVVPTSKNPVVRFYWAAVLEDPQHPAEAQPYVDVSVVNQSKGMTLYKKRFYANDPSYSGWVSYDGGNWKGIPWQLAEINVLKYVGDTLILKVEAADCAYSGHGGYAYLDAEE
jgi:hypothetical protein